MILENFDGHVTFKATCKIKKKLYNDNKVTREI